MARRQTTGKKEERSRKTNFRARGDELFPCRFCPQIFKSDRGMLTHMARIHGKRFAYAEVPRSRSGEPLEEEPLILRSRPRERSPHPRRIPVSVKIKPRNPVEVAEWLKQLCLRIVWAETLEDALAGAPKRYRRQVEFIQKNLGRVRRTLRLTRYRRLSSPEPRARFLADSLSDLNYSPSYAEQLITEKRRQRERQLRQQHLSRPGPTFQHG